MANQFRVSIGVDIDAARAKAGAGETRQAVQSIGQEASQATPKVQALDAALAGLHDSAANNNARAWTGLLASEGMALDNLRAKYNPLFATIQQYKAAQTEIRTAHAMGALSSDEMTAALARQRQQALATIAAYKGVGAEAAALDALRAKYDPLYAASVKYQQALTEIEKAENAGALAADRAFAARRRAASVYSQDVASVGARETNAGLTARAIVGSQTIVPDRAADIQAYAASLDQLRSKYNPLYSTIQQYKVAQAEIREAHAVGALSADEMTAALSRQRQQALSTIATIKGLGTAQVQAQAATGASRRSFGWMQLGMQANDVGTMTMLGMPATQIAASQGPQIFQAMQMWEGGVSGAMSDISSTIGGLITRFPLLTAGAAAAGVAMAGLYAVTRKEGPTVEEALTRHEELVKRIKEAYGDAAANVGKLRTEEKSILAFQAGVNAQDLKSNLATELERDRNALRARFIDQGSGMVLGPAMPIENQLRTFIGSTDDSGKALATLRKELTDIGTKTADADLKTLIDSIITATAKTEDLRAAVVAASDDLPKLSANAVRLAERLKSYNNELPKLGVMGALPLSREQEIERQYQATISQATNREQRDDVTEARNRALGRLREQLDLTRQADDLGTQAIVARTAAERASIAAAQARIQALQDGKSPAETAEAERIARTNVFAQEAASSRSTLEQAQIASVGVGLTGLPATIAQINARYDLEIQKADKATEAIDNLRKARELEIQTATRSAVLQPLQDTAQSSAELERAVALQRATFGKSAGETANLSEQMRLYNEYARAGVQITPELGKAIAEAGARYGAAAGEMDKVTKAQQDAIGRMDGLRSATKSALGSAMEGDWESVGKAATDWASGLITDNLTQGLLGRQGEAGGGAFGDFFSGLLGGGARGDSAANPVYVTMGGAGAGGLFGGLTAANTNGLGVVGGTDLLSKYREAIASVESSGNYSALGPITKSGDRAYGRYGVMGSNVGPWTQQALGYSMNPSQFLASSSAQDAVFNKMFGGLLSKYGNANDAASAWFTGRPQATGANATDILGTTGSGYVEKFNAALGTATTGLESFASTAKGASTGSVGGVAGYPSSLELTPAQASKMPAGVSAYGTGWADQQVAGLGSIFSTLTNGLGSIVDQFIPGIGSVLGQLLNGIANAGTGSTGGGGGFFSWLGSLFGGGGGGWGVDNSAAFMPYALGGVPPARGLHSYANQVVSTPTVFAFAKGAGVMGEAGEKEGIFPMTRDAAGRLGVRASWGGGQGAQDGGSNIVINNYSGAQVQHETTRDSRGRRQEKFVISDAVGDAVSTPGGGADKAMRQKYGVRSGGIRR